MSTEMVPTYAEIVAASDPKTFPLWALEGVKSALCCYVAEWYGRQDVVHLAEAGVSRIEACDLDVPKLAEMRSVYAHVRSVNLHHAYAGGALMTLSGGWNRKDAMSFDLVTLDPWTNDMPRVWREEVPLALKVAPRVIVGYCAAPFDHTGDPLANVQRIAPEGSTVDEVLQRSGHRGGVFWAVVSRST